MAKGKRLGESMFFTGWQLAAIDRQVRGMSRSARRSRPQPSTLWRSSLSGTADRPVADDGDGYNRAANPKTAMDPTHNPYPRKPMISWSKKTYALAKAAADRPQPVALDVLPPHKHPSATQYKTFAHHGSV